MILLYVELCCVSNFIFLCGVSCLEELVECVKVLGYSVIVVVDECSMVGVVCVYVVVKEVGIKLLVGS